MYVAAKNLQIYAEDSHLENESGDGPLIRMAKGKVTERQLAKQSADIAQIDAFKVNIYRIRINIINILNIKIFDIDLR